MRGSSSRCWRARSRSCPQVQQMAAMGGHSPRAFTLGRGAGGGGDGGGGGGGYGGGGGFGGRSGGGGSGARTAAGGGSLRRRGSYASGGGGSGLRELLSAPAGARSGCCCCPCRPLPLARVLQQPPGAPATMTPKEEMRAGMPLAALAPERGAVGSRSPLRKRWSCSRSPSPRRDRHRDGDRDRGAAEGLPEPSPRAEAAAGTERDRQKQSPGPSGEPETTPPSSTQTGPALLSIRKAFVFQVLLVSGLPNGAPVYRRLPRLLRALSV